MIRFGYRVPPFSNMVLPPPVFSTGLLANSLVKHQSSTQAKKQQQNSLVPEAKCQSDVYQAGRLKLGVGTVPFKNAGSAPALAA